MSDPMLDELRKVAREGGRAEFANELVTDLLALINDNGHMLHPAAKAAYQAMVDSISRRVIRPSQSPDSP